MARVNVDERALYDFRFRLLGDLTGKGQFDALGRTIFLWEYCTNNATYFISEPLVDVIAQLPGFCELMIKAELAERCENNQIRIKGTEGRVEWLKKLRDSGKKGARSTKAKWRGQAAPSGVATQCDLPGPLSLAPAPVPSPALAPVLEKEKTEKKEKLNLPARSKNDLVAPTLNQLIWSSYLETYRERYKTEPVRNATVNAQIANLAKRLGQEAVEVVKFYVKHNNGFYVQKCHPIGLCLQDAEALRTQWARGRALTRNDVKSFEQTDAVKSQLERIERGEL